jgi:hypothetical protein
MGIVIVVAALALWRVLRARSEKVYAEALAAPRAPAAPAVS